MAIAKLRATSGEAKADGGPAREGKGEVQQVVEGDRESNDEGLADFHAVDASEYINAIGAEGGQHRHVEVVERACGGDSGQLRRDSVSSAVCAPR